MDFQIGDKVVVKGSAFLTPRGLFDEETMSEEFYKKTGGHLGGLRGPVVSLHSGGDYAVRLGPETVVHFHESALVYIHPLEQLAHVAE